MWGMCFFFHFCQLWAVDVITKIAFQETLYFENKNTFRLLENDRPYLSVLTAQASLTWMRIKQQWKWIQDIFGYKYV